MDGIYATKSLTIPAVFFVAFVGWGCPAFSQTKASFSTHASTKRTAPLNYITVGEYEERCRLQEQPGALATHDNTKGLGIADRARIAFTPENSGRWDTAAGGFVWKLGLHLPGARAGYLTFGNFHLEPGASVVVYNAHSSASPQRFTAQHNNAYNCLSTAPFIGDSVIIELHVAGGVDSYGRVELTKVYRDTKGLFCSLFPESAPPPGPSPNINCENGLYWQTEKRSVCKIITDGALSTGTLVGNTTKNNTPYVITAAHTVFDSLHAAESVFIFNYEYDCGETTISDQHTISGARLMAISQGLDYSLLQLNQLPPPSFRAFYSGWDMRASIPMSGVTIHHPVGEHKQIAIDYHPLTSGSFSQGYLANSFWKVERWDIGFTEPGSSGAPLFDQNHRMVGSLTGGFSSLQKTGSDYFTKLSAAWQAPSLTGNAFQNLLDPGHTGKTWIDGYDPYGFSAVNCDTVSNISPHERMEISSKGLAAGYISGHNSMKLSGFAEKFSAPNKLMISGMFINVARSLGSDSSSSILVKVWEGSSLPSTEIYSKRLYLKNLFAGVNHINFDSAVSVNGNFFVGYEINYQLPGDSFAVYHAINRNRGGGSSMFVRNGSWQNIRDLTPIGYHTSLAIQLSTCYGRPVALRRDEVQLYPNPAHNQMVVSLPSSAIPDDIQCFDISGRKHPIRYQPSETAPHVYFNLPSGLYILMIRSSGMIYLSKFVVQAK